MANSRLFLVFSIVVVALSVLITSSSVEEETLLTETKESNVTLSPVESPVEDREIDVSGILSNLSIVEDLIENKQGAVSSTQLGFLTNLRKTLSNLVRRRPSRLPSDPAPGTAAQLYPPGTYNPNSPPPGFSQPVTYNAAQPGAGYPANPAPNPNQVAPYPPTDQQQQFAFFSVPTIGDNFQLLSPGPNDPPQQLATQQPVQQTTQFTPQPVQQPFPQSQQQSVLQPFQTQYQQSINQQPYQNPFAVQQPFQQQNQFTQQQPIQQQNQFSQQQPIQQSFQQPFQQSLYSQQSLQQPFQHTQQAPVLNQYSYPQPSIQQQIQPQYINSKPPSQQEPTQAITIYSEPESPEPPRRSVVVGTAYVTQTSTLIATAYVTRTVTVTTENRITSTVVGTAFVTRTATVTTENRFCKFIIPTTIPTIIQPSYVTPYAPNNYITPTRLPQYY